MLGSRESARVAKNMSNMMRKKKFFKRNGGQFLERQFISGEADVEETKLFEPEELEKATDNFKIDRVLGQGGQDTVYKGMLRDGNIVAVKKSKIVDESRVEEFINEVVNLSKVNHRNVVKLLGFCLKTEDPLLVYEDVPNGTLYQYIYDEQEEFPLTWEIRLRIATEIAGALTHLHSSATLSTYRRDITSKNILLDGKYGAKLADIGTSRSAAIDDQTDLTIAVQGVFDLADTGISISVAVDDETDLTTAVHDSSGLADIGASRSVPTDDQTDLATAVQGTFDLADTGASRSVAVDDETDFTTAVHGPSGLEDIGTSRSDATDEQTDLTTAGHGTFGNLDPEESSQSTKMSDVYGFGVVLVELLIGQKLLSIQRSKQGRSLATFFMQAIEKNKLFNIVDARVKREGKKASIIAFAKLAKRCLNSNAKKRPAMKEVAAVLEDIRQSEIKASDTHDEQPLEEGENGTWLPSLGDLTGSSSFVLP
ncbi:hypothetical protein TIFTF001_015128 [Ficus carica]|uniref:Protein kinase domain-containing protein n=1 Tax=Ficus carica TaxID=3494 RepID=A0AA87ZY53_FICCA|nr:hypothetical protein TIFTF001_015128 [Ficus carica]